MNLPKLKELVKEVKYLRVILESKLNWDSHTKNKTNKACAALHFKKRRQENTSTNEK